MSENKIKSAFCTVRIMDVPYCLDGAYDYYIPLGLEDAVRPGCFVTVPFGKNNRSTKAVVTALKSESPHEQVKPLIHVSEGEASLDGEAMELCRFLCDHTLCTYGEAVRTVVPTAALTRLDEVFYPSGDEKGIDKLTEKALAFYVYIKHNAPVSRQRLRSSFGDEAALLTSALLRMKLIRKETKTKEATNYKYIAYVSLTDEFMQDPSKALQGMRSPLQRAIVDLLLKTGRITRDEICVRLEKNVSPQITALVKKGVLCVEKTESYRNPYIDVCQNTNANTTPLSEEQSCAFEKLAELYDNKRPCAALLHGVTGSGKTRVIKEMIDKVIADSKGVIMLVPEISLTPQTVGYFCAQYGERVAVVHSNLSQGERFDAWKRIKRGEASVVIGTRSAIFAPVKDLGMIVIDEEQEHTYKSDTDPKYLAHDVARFRAGKTGAMMLLSSATPSVSSYHKAVSGTYTLVEMNSRYGDAKLPRVIVSDMRKEAQRGNVTPLGEELSTNLARVYGEKKQSIVFLNRRGYNSCISCRVCGEAILCPNCSVSLTYHTRMPLSNTSDAEEYYKMRAQRGVLSCHYCGYKTRLPDCCPTCKAEHFRFMGYGTQRAEEELQRAVPGARVLRMDTDTTSTKGSHTEILEKFRNGEADILLGTQMVTKGHDFPAVTLVGVMNADSSLYLDDYRAAEKTFSMLTQVVGRAGRGKDEGLAVVQTANPDSEVIRLAAKQDYKTFYEKEIRLRKALVFPPFCDIAVLTLSGTDEALLSASAVRLSERTKELLGTDFNDVWAVMFGPFEAPVYKVQNTCRMRLVLKCRLNRRSRQLIRQLLCEFGKAVKSINLTADLNPSSL